MIALLPLHCAMVLSQWLSQRALKGEYFCLQHLAAADSRTSMKREKPQAEGKAFRRPLQKRLFGFFLFIYYFHRAPQEAERFAEKNKNRAKQY
jgi:hypothetical protein